MKNIDGLNDTLIDCFFDTQSLISVDWCYYKYYERILAFFEFGFFIPFALADDKHCKAFATNIFNKGIDNITQEFANYTNRTVNEFIDKLHYEMDNNKFNGPFCICSSRLPLWKQLEQYVNSPNDIA